MGLFDAIKNAIAEPTKDELFEIEYYICSSAYYQKELEKLVKKIMPVNNRYIIETFDEAKLVVWEHNPCYIKHVRFEKDTKNEHDPNAIKIIAGSNSIDMAKIGYIPMEENEKFKKWLDANKVYNTNLIVYGGNKKVISKNGGTMLVQENYKVVLRALIKK